MLPSNLLFLFWSEIVLDVESLSDLFRTLSSDHASNREASEIKQVLYVQVVCSQDKLEECTLIHLHKLSLPVLHLVLGHQNAIAILLL